MVIGSLNSFRALSDRSAGVEIGQFETLRNAFGNSRSVLRIGAENNCGNDRYQGERGESQQNDGLFTRVLFVFEPGVTPATSTRLLLVGGTIAEKWVKLI